MDRQSIHPTELRVPDRIATTPTERSDVFLSVLICTHRRPNELATALDSLVSQFPNSEFRISDLPRVEIVVVENDTEPSRKIHDIVDAYATRLPVIWVFSSPPGLSRARNLGADVAKGEFLVYLDDDAQVGAGWLEALLRGITEHDPDIFGGPVRPSYRQPRPEWFLNEYANDCFYGDQVRRLRAGEFLSGGNFGVRKRVVEMVNGFPLDYGMTGTKLAYCEETALMIAAQQANPDLRVIYFPGAWIRHEVRPEKMSIGWILRSHIASARDFARAKHGLSLPLSPYSLPPSRFIAKHIAAHTFLGVVSVARLFVALLRSLIFRNPALWRRCFMEQVLRHIDALYFDWTVVRLRLLAK